MYVHPGRELSFVGEFRIPQEFSVLCIIMSGLQHDGLLLRALRLTVHVFVILIFPFCTSSRVS